MTILRPWRPHRRSRFAGACLLTLILAFAAGSLATRTATAAVPNRICVSSNVVGHGTDVTRNRALRKARIDWIGKASAYGAAYARTSMAAGYSESCSMNPTSRNRWSCTARGRPCRYNPPVTRTPPGSVPKRPGLRLRRRP